MRRIDTIIRCFGVMFVLAMMMGCSAHSVSVQPYPQENIIPVKRLKGSDTAKIMNNRVFFIDKGETIPLALSMESDFMTIKQAKIDLVAKQRLYFRIKMPADLSERDVAELKHIDAQTLSRWSDEKRRAFLKRYMLYISKDAVHWAPLSSIPALREVLGYRMGSVSFMMAAGSEHGVGASLIVKTVR